jgi:hypothetical protein
VDRSRKNCGQIQKELWTDPGRIVDRCGQIQEELWRLWTDLGEIVVEIQEELWTDPGRIVDKSTRGCDLNQEELC